MNEVTLPPSPNWYLSTVLACAEDGTVAWGARNAIVVARVKSDVKILKYSIIDDAHTGKVASLAFSPKFGQAHHNLLVSGGDEHVVRIWNLDNNAAIMANTYADNRQIVIGVDWSKADPNLVFCVSSDGLLVAWNLTQNVSQQSFLGKLSVTCLSSCPHDCNIVALGTKNGLVYIINVNGNGNIIYKLRGHDTEITSLSWCPTETNVLQNGEAKDMLLASGAKDRSVFIWRAGGDGRYQIHLQLPTNPLDSRQHKSKLSIATGNWTSLCWPEPRLLLVSSVWGELLSFRLSTNEKPKPMLIHGSHARGLFCIASIINRGESGDRNWRSETAESLDVWTSAQDRLVVCSRLERNVSKILYHIPTQGGFVYSIAASPLDTSRVAFGVGDAMLRLWNLCEPHENTFDITTLWQKIKGKVMTITWHPEKENLLAFGTCEGRVGIFDTNSNKPPILFRQYHRHSVYCLGWGPESSGKHYVLYSCGGGELVYFIPEKPNEMPKSIIQKDCTEFSWKPDFSFLAVGYENGLISFLNRELKECGRSIYALKKAVQRIAWHPKSTSTDLHLSPLQHQMAVATNAVTVTIFDVMKSTSNVTESENSNVGNDDANLRDISEICAAITCRVVGTLNGHSARVVDLTWSPHISGYLASASFDQTVRVWKTETQQLVCTYTGHRGPVYSCMWSPLDPDLIITGGADFTLRVWRVSEQQSLMPLEVIAKPKAKRVRTKKNKSTTDRASSTLQPDDEHTLSSQQLKIDDSIGNANIVEFSTTDQEIRESTVKDAKKKRSKKPTYFPTTVKASNNRGAMLRMVEELFKNATITSPDELGGHVRAPGLSADPTIDNRDCESAAPSLFASRPDIVELLETERLAHVAAGQYQTATELDLWCNNLKRNLEDAAKEKRLNDMLLSLAPSLSTRFWQEMCEAYAAQLTCEGNHRKAVSYLLCIHKINQAIRVFAEAKMYREAYVLAKCKLDAADPIIDNLLTEWAASAVKDGNYEDAIQCHIKLRNYDEAVKYLCRRGDGVSLEIAARLALLSGDEESCKTLAQRAVNEALSRSDYTSAENISKIFPQIQFCEVIIFAKRIIEEAFEKCNDDYIWKWLEEGNSCSMLLKLAERYPDSNRYYHDILEGADISRPDIVSMLWLNVGTQLALAAACSSDHEKYTHLVTAASMIYEDEIARSRKDAVPVRAQDFLIKFLSTLDGTGPFSVNSVFANNDVAACTSLRAYLCQGVFHWLPRFSACDLETNGRITLIRSFITRTITDLLNDRSFAYTTLSNKVEKLERELADEIGDYTNVSLSSLPCLGKLQKYNDGDEGIGMETNANVASLSHRLGEYRAEKNKFLEERVAAPCPVWAFDNACQLTRSLFRGDTEKELSELVYVAWMNAVKIPA